MILEILAGWLIVSIPVALAVGAIIRNRDNQDPSPNHPAHRTHKTLHQHHTDGDPLNDWEAPRWDQIQKRLAQDEQAT